MINEKQNGKKWVGDCREGEEVDGLRDLNTYFLSICG